MSRNGLHKAVRTSLSITTKNIRICNTGQIVTFHSTLHPTSSLSHKFCTSYLLDRKTIAVEEEARSYDSFNKRIAQGELGDFLGCTWTGSCFKVSGCSEKDSFVSKQGVMTYKNVKLCLQKVDSDFHQAKSGHVTKKSVHGCMIDCS
ncbi:hypothetical protein RF11_03220 [Thelohanellus kitauei]|uniref:Small ribosomal subunit protein eS6 n=1 Tax=Thelohanellus kitauei TaxID=669202 RepID=A0A0C2MIJ8_THEKT|nr:hypothetical protein RF11_03220 [Thelohanellus kitauei]